MYILLTGRPPYSGRDTEAILEQVRTNPLVITPFKVLGLSEESVELLKLLLAIQPTTRIEAKEAVIHPWITLHRSAGLPEVEIILENLQKFNYDSKLKEAVHVFLASQVISNSELAIIRKNFQILDVDGDGKITRSELFSQYSKLMKIDEARRVVDEIIANLDQDGDGNIDYTEFLISCYDLQKSISVQQLEIAFKMFDSDDSGTITLDEIRNTLGSDQIIGQDAWELILKEADLNGDGCIDLKEFIALMSTKVNQEKL
jgi:calcium-dependent protein kinase